MATPSKISVGVFITRRHECWVAYCPALKLYGFSEESEGAALDDFDKSIQTFFELQREIGRLDETLTSLGWVRSARNYNIPKREFTSTVLPYRGKEAKVSNRQISIPA